MVLLLCFLVLVPMVDDEKERSNDKSKPFRFISIGYFLPSRKSARDGLLSL